MNKKFISIIVLVIALGASLLVGCGSNSSSNEDKDMSKLESIKDKKKIVVGTSADYPPFEFHTMIDGEDNIVGLDIEIAKYIADSLDVELEIKEMDFSNLLGGISTGMVDIVLSGMNPTPEREKEVDFTDIYYDADLSILIRKSDSDKIKTEEDLIGKSIGVQISTTQEEIAGDIKDTDVNSFKTNPDIVMNLKTNKLDCAMMETLVAESFAKANDDVMVVENLNFDTSSGGTAIATSKGNEDLIKELNKIISQLKDEGLITKWLIEAQDLSANAI